jgi:hypothetical protein
LTDGIIDFNIGGWPIYSLEKRKWKVVFAASPNTLRQSKIWRKTSCKRTLFMATWDWEEIVAALRYALALL